MKYTYFICHASVRDDEFKLKNSIIETDVKVTDSDTLDEVLKKIDNEVIINIVLLDSIDE